MEDGDEIKTAARNFVSSGLFLLSFVTVLFLCCFPLLVSGPKSPVPRGQWAFSLSLSELKSIRKSKPGLGWSYLIFITKEGISIQALHFHRGGTKALLKAICKYVILAT